MPGIDLGIVSEPKQDLPNRPHQRSVIPAREIDTSNGPRKERVADEELLAGITGLADLKTHTPWAMTGRVMHANLMGSKAHALVSTVVETVDRWRGFHLQPEEFTKCDGVFVQRQVATMKVDRSLQLTLGLGHPGHVVDMTVCEENVLDVELPGSHDFEQQSHLVARVDDYRLASLLAPQHESVLLERWDRTDFENQIEDRIQNTEDRI
jgi:hypothetical protein